jgi:hypothetical protein
MRPPKVMAGPVCLWLPRLLLGVGAYFDFIRANERLSCTRTAHIKCMPNVRGLEWEAYVACWLGFPLQGVQ